MVGVNNAALPVETNDVVRRVFSQSPEFMFPEQHGIFQLLARGDVAGQDEVVKPHIHQHIHHVAQEEHIVANNLTTENRNIIQCLEIARGIETKCQGLGKKALLVRQVVVVEELSGKKRRHMLAVDNDGKGDIDHAVFAAVLQKITLKAVQMRLDKGVALA